MSTSRRPTYPPEPKPNVTTTGLCMYGVGAGLLGIAAMTAAEKIEQIFTGHPTSLVGGRVLESLLNLSPRTDGDMFKLNIMMNAVRGAGAGILRAMMSFNGMRGPVADFMLVGIGLIVDNMLEVKAGVGSWAWHWPANEQMYELLHKAIYAVSTGYIVDKWLY